MSNKITKFDKFQELMFEDIDKLNHLTPREREQLLRYRFAFTQLLETPSMSDTLLRDLLMTQFGIQKTQAYRDIGNMRVILPNIRNAGKEWIRYIVNEELKEAIQEAKTSNKLKERILAIAALAKYNKLDQDDAEEMPWDQIIPTPIEPTSDPTVLGIKPLPNKLQVIEELYKKYRDDIEIDDIPFEDVTDDSPDKEANLF